MTTGEKSRQQDVDSARIASVLHQLFGELVDGPGGSAYMLNSGDHGLLRSLDRLSAADASRSVGGGAPVCAHVDHLRYGLSLLNRWNAGEDPFGGADWGASWKVTQLSEREWDALRTRLAAEVHAWQAALRAFDATREGALEIGVSSVAHLAYHLGALRQVAPASRGPSQ